MRAAAPALRLSSKFANDSRISVPFTRSPFKLLGYPGADNHLGPLGAATTRGTRVGHQILFATSQLSDNETKSSENTAFRFSPSAPPHRTHLLSGRPPVQVYLDTPDRGWLS